MTETDDRTDDRPEPCQDAAFFKEMRQRLGYSLREAAAKVGVNDSYLYQVEVGDRPLNEKLRRKLLLGYGVIGTDCPNCDRMAARLKLAKTMLEAALGMLRGAEVTGQESGQEGQR